MVYMLQTVCINIKWDQQNLAARSGSRIKNKWMESNNLKLNDDKQNLW